MTHALESLQQLRADLEALHRRERHAAAVATTAAKVASERSLPLALTALAEEIVQADELVGVQVLTKERTSNKLFMLGTAGFPASQGSTFYAQLMECRRRGADLLMLEAFTSGEPLIIEHRYDVVMNDPAWAPLHDYHRNPEWETFASIPIVVRDEIYGILNAFVAPGIKVDEELFSFLQTMAEQAALAIDYASLLEEERLAAQREERNRLARDLHDSVVQQVFSMGMLAQTIQVLAQPDKPAATERILEVAEDLGEITDLVLQDLRTLVGQLRPSAVQGIGLVAALESLMSATHRQTGLIFSFDIDDAVEHVHPELAEDLYHVASEAIHNAVKHSSAHRVDVRLHHRDEAVVLDVHDDGGGATSTATTALPGDEEELPAGNGLSFMRQRVERWHGDFRIELHDGDGVTVHADIPVPTPATDETGHSAGIH